MSDTTPRARARDAGDDPINENIDRAEHALFAHDPDEDEASNPTRPNTHGQVATGGAEEPEEGDGPPTHGSEGGSGATKNIWSGDDLPGGADTDRSWN